MIETPRRIKVFNAAQILFKDIGLCHVEGKRERVEQAGKLRKTRGLRGGRRRRAKEKVPAVEQQRVDELKEGRAKDDGGLGVADERGKLVKDELDNVGEGRLKGFARLISQCLEKANKPKRELA